MTAGLATLLLPLFLAGGGPSNDDCLTCHSDPQARSEKGRSVFVDARKHAQSTHGGLACVDCHEGIKDLPHEGKLKKPACTGCHEEAAAAVKGSVHGAFGEEACSGCHGAPHEVRKLGQPAGTQCASCHEDVVKAYRSSVHAAMGPERDGAVCNSCHGPAHGMLAHGDPASRVAKRNLPQTCGGCHASPEFISKHTTSIARPVEAYERSVHGRLVAGGNDKAASCADCHDSHGVLPSRDPRSEINHASVARTCGKCHAEIAKVYGESIHGTAAARGIEGSPVCTDCHGEHAILAPSEKESLVNPARVSAVTCGHCHGDERLAQKYNLPEDKVPSFRGSFHGLAARSGSQTVANCASCHGVHNILPSSDPRSTINPANLGQTCGACHPGAGQRFAIGPVHVRPGGGSEHVSVRVIRVAYLWLIPLTIGGMLVHHLADFFRKLLKGVHRGPRGEQLPRMNRHFRIAHGLVILSFPTLVITGFALKYPEAWWAQGLLNWEGELGLRGWIHRAAGVVLCLSMVYHGLHLLLVRRHRRLLPAMLPRLQDATDAVAMLRYNFGLSPQRPRLPGVSYIEKAEYWAFLWGTLVMALSGFLLWFNSWTLQNFPTWVADAATAIHFYEAVLATLAIGIWHFYIVIFDPEVYPMDKAWLTGRVDAEHLKHARPDYYHELKAELERRAAAGPSKPGPGDGGSQA